MMCRAVDNAKKLAENGDRMQSLLPTDVVPHTQSRGRGIEVKSCACRSKGLAAIGVMRRGIAARGALLLGWGD